MVARRRKRSKKWVSWLIILILLIVAGMMVWLVWDNYFNDDKKTDDGDGNESIIIDKEEKKADDGEEQEQKVVEKEEIMQYDGENPNTANELTGVVTYAGTTGDKLTIRVNINQYLSDGNCVLKLLFEDGATAYNDEVGIIGSASTSTCEGFDVPMAGLSSGDYKIIINLNADDKTGVINGGVKL